MRRFHQIARLFEILQCGRLLMLFTLCLLATSVDSAAPEQQSADKPKSDAASLLTQGEKIFRSQCVQCHGDQGQGTKDNYPDPLVGDASIGELTETITETMPEEAPDQCVGADAKAVASFMHHSFYSEAAQLRRRPARATLQRLTGTQLRQSLTDLYAHFGGIPSTLWDKTQKERGLNARYYTGSGWDEKKNLKIKRVDPVVDFDFGIKGPGKGVDGKDFHAHWEGGLRVEQTGRYEIIVRSQTSFMCSFGWHREKLIDNHVQSEGRTEFRRMLNLTGGRVYLIKLDMTQRKRKGETPPAKISLSWVPPGQTEELIPARNLYPGWTPSMFRLETQMPPDDRSYGFERGISVDATWDEAVTSAAIEFAEAARDELWPDYQNHHKKEKLSRPDLIRKFLRELIAVAHRGTADDVDANRIIDAAVKANEDEGDILKQAILLTLKSPRFLYPTLDTDRKTAQRAMNRLALTLHDSLPTESWVIEQMIGKNQLKNVDGLRQVSRRMLDDARTRTKLREFFHHWLEVSNTGDLRKDDKLHAGFDEALISDLRESLDQFVDQVVWSETSDYRQLMLANWAPTTDRLATYYGKAWQPVPDQDSKDKKSNDANTNASRPEFLRSVSDPNAHVGVLTHPLMMAQFAHHQTSSPIHRGVFLIRHVFGRTLRPPNSAFAPLSPDLHPDLTTRERIDLQTGPDSCQICHVKINPLGFSLEQFDASGRLRQQDRGKPVDARGYYLSRDDQKIEFNGARQLGEAIASSPDAHQAFVTKLFQYFVKQPVAAYGNDRLQELTQRFRDSGFNIRELLVEIAVVSAQPTLQTNEGGNST